MIIYGNLAGVSIGHCGDPGALVNDQLHDSGGCVGPNFQGQHQKGGDPKNQSPEKAEGYFAHHSFRTDYLCRPGGINLGITTPTEAGAVGAFAGLLLCLIQGDLTWKKLWTAF